MKNQRGQFTMEMILITIVLTSIAILTSRYAQSNALVADIVEGPWRPIQGMIEDGVWQSGDKAKSNHPSMKSRHSSNAGQAL